MPLTPEEIDWVVRHVREWRDQPIPEELTNPKPGTEQADKYWKEVARRDAQPCVLTRFLTASRTAFRAAFPASTLPADAESELYAAGACGAYGPDDGDLTPNELARLMAQAAIGPSVPPERVVERILVRGLLQPKPLPEDWGHQWQRAANALAQMIKPSIVLSLGWIRAHVLKGTEWDRADWVEDEARRVAFVIREHLIQGCDCWRGWAKFGIELPARGLYTCAVRHTLTAWDGQTDLGRFLWSAAVQGNLADRASINEFRKGILAKLIQPPLAAGPVLLCQQPLEKPAAAAAAPPATEVAGRRADGALEEPAAAPPACHARMCPDDRCSRADQRHWGRVKEPDWWLWREGTFAATECRRCSSCGCLFFQSGGRCPDPCSVSGEVAQGLT